MAGKEVGLQFAIQDDAFGFTGATTVEDLQLDCELICAYLTDPGFREDGTTQLRHALPQMFEGMKHQPGGPLGQKFLPGLYGGDPRVGIPQLEAVQAVTLDQMKTWITGAFDAAPIDVVVVGDLDVEKTVAACAQTFGALGKRRAGGYLFGFEFGEKAHVDTLYSDAGFLMIAAPSLSRSSAETALPGRFV